jgi:hypothetical protein
MSTNGGFPPIKMIQIKEKIEIKSKKERGFATIPVKNLDIRQILSNKAVTKMIEPAKDNIVVLEAL